MSQAALRVVGKEQNSDRKRALEAALSQIDRAFGKGSVMKLGSRDLGLATDAVSTGSLGLDIALGIGGLPRGRVVEVYGPESSGKTTLALHVVAEIQKKGGTAAYVDAEHALDPLYAKKLGVDNDEMLISQPESTGEQALEITDTALVRLRRCRHGDRTRWRRWTPKAELEGEMGEFVCPACRRVEADEPERAAQADRLDLQVQHHACCSINQIRMKIGIMFGNPETTTGGNALKFYSSVRPGYPPHRRYQGSRRSGGQPDPRQSGQEQGGPALQAG